MVTGLDEVLSSRSPKVWNHLVSVDRRAGLIDCPGRYFGEKRRNGGGLSEVSLPDPE